jgi:hypothetical protein
MHVYQNSSIKGQNTEQETVSPLAHGFNRFPYDLPHFHKKMLKTVAQPQLYA